MLPQNALAVKLNEHSASKSLSIFALGLPDCTPPEPSQANDLLISFNKPCQTTLDAIAPMKLRSKLPVKTSPWIDDSLRSLKRLGRRAEKRWTKTKLHVHYLYMKDLLTSYNKQMNDARANYFSNLINNQHNPIFLFKTINSLINPAPPALPASSNADC